MTKKLNDYLSALPNAKHPDQADLEAYRDEMVDKVIPRNLRAAAERKRQVSDSRLRLAQSSAKRDHDET